MRRKVLNRKERVVNTLRMLSVDAIDKANSGHPGLPLGAAPMAYELWSNHMNHYPKDPNWLNRDRFILSAGHGSALLYSLLTVFGYGLEIDDLKDFRQLHSKTPGHPEYGHTLGVECTTGPLGAGISMGVGMAVAEEALAKRYNRPDFEIIDHYTFVLCGDGDLMEGISNEASSFAGTQQLNKLIVLYDSNAITIEGSTDIAFKENVRQRYEALGWNTLEVTNGNDCDAIGEAISKAKTSNKPTLIEVHTEIGYGSPKAGDPAVHGSPLGEEGTSKTRSFFHLEDVPPFTIPNEVTEEIGEVKSSLKDKYTKWENLFEEYKRIYPEESKRLLNGMEGNFDLSFMEEDEFWYGPKDQATRGSSGMILNRISKKLSVLFGGSADLGPSNKSVMENTGYFSPKNREGRNINFGVREHAMGAIANGIALHGGWKAFCATFLVFSDYMKPQIRLSALMGVPVTYIFTHDSIGVGEDGPTHQPIEHLAMLRSIPNLITYRPADTTEVAAGWAVAMRNKNTPLAFSLTRQTLPEIENTSKEAMKGGYIVKKEGKDLDCILIGTGSELQYALEAAKDLEEKGFGIRVVSMPSQELFEAQAKSYRSEVLPEICTKRISIEAASTFGWHKYTGFEGRSIGIDEFGASGPGDEVYQSFGITKERIVKEALEILK
ncbi:MAG: transketolase [Tissierellia bacterium]|nr:transketolase [Tissierellia bacterium]